MKHLLKETQTYTYERNGKNCYATIILVEETKRYQYDTENDRMAHMQKMRKKGFSTTEDIFLNGSWYASYKRLTRTSVEE